MDTTLKETAAKYFEPNTIAYLECNSHFEVYFLDPTSKQSGFIVTDPETQGQLNFEDGSIVDAEGKQITISHAYPDASFNFFEVHYRFVPPDNIACTHLSTSEFLNEVVVPYFKALKEYNLLVGIKEAYKSADLEDMLLRKMRQSIDQLFSFTEAFGRLQERDVPTDKREDLIRRLDLLRQAGEGLYSEMNRTTQETRVIQLEQRIKRLGLVKPTLESIALNYVLNKPK